jgi:endonuclease YncB( thermonuclease family)
VHIRQIPLLLLLACLAGCEPATAITGPARIIDGDTLEMGTTRIRLHAVDAFEGQQPCQRNGEAWRCGAAATRQLEALVGTATLVCTQTDIDSYGRTVAVCRNGSVDIGAEMVRAGLALAYRQYGEDYVREEAEAEGAGRGVWAGEFTEPWEWRRNQQPPEPEPPSSPDPNGCLIKGNINREGERIYHVPGSRSYEQTIIDESRGERWFCSEDDALRDGWRAPRG